MNTRPTALERNHMAKVKALPCSVCDAQGPSEAHHIKQSTAFLCIALCPDCHRGPILGLHGQRRMWLVRKLDELDALNVTVQRLMEESHA